MRNFSKIPKIWFYVQKTVFWYRCRYIIIHNSCIFYSISNFLFQLKTEPHTFLTADCLFYDRDFSSLRKNDAGKFFNFNNSMRFFKIKKFSQWRYIKFSLAKTQFPPGFKQNVQILIFKCYIWMLNLISHFFLLRKRVVAYLVFKLK